MVLYTIVALLEAICSKEAVHYTHIAEENRPRQKDHNEYVEELRFEREQVPESKCAAGNLQTTQHILE